MNIVKNITSSLQKTDLSETVASKKDLVKYHANANVIKTISLSIDVFRDNYLDNTEALLKHTGITERQYSNRLKSLGCRSYRSIKYAIIKKSNMGLDIIHFAAMASFFKIPIGECMMRNFIFEKIDLHKRYNIHPNSLYHGKKVRTESARKVKAKTIAEKMQRKKKENKAKYPKKHVNLMATLVSNVSKQY